ncbi:MAG: hypothetical protein ACE5IW_13015 [bacterium]
MPASADVCISTWHEQCLAQRTGFSFGTRTLDCVALSKCIAETVMDRRMRTRMSGGVGRAGEKPALTRLYRDL